ncbi:MAG: LPP20 family lipoprotein [Nitrospirae bacterium]|nr:LPP20 family lipoprotein [Nitrospirota bacterium]
MNSRPFQAIGLALWILSLTFLPEARAERSAEALETVGPGTVNWTTGIVTAQGIGASPANAVNAAQARAMAERAAFSVAVRNLLEAIKGVRVDSATLVENMIVTSDVIKTRVSGLVKGARPIKTEVQPDGSVEVTVGISLRGELFDAVLPKEFGRSVSVTGPALPSKPVTGMLPTKPGPSSQSPVPSVEQPGPLPPSAKDTTNIPGPPPAQSAPTPPEPASQAVSTDVYTGLIVDARGLGLKPALAPRLLDEQGKEIYAGQVLSREQAVHAGVAGYSKDMIAGTRQPRVTDNPLVVKGLKTSGSKNTDIMLGAEEIKTIQQTDATAHYLKQARVVVVYD